jgi:hypothetical protein
MLIKEKSVACLCTKNEQSEKEVNKMVPFRTAQKE